MSTRARGCIACISYASRTLTLHAPLVATHLQDTPMDFRQLCNTLFDEIGEQPSPDSLALAWGLDRIACALERLSDAASCLERSMRRRRAPMRPRGTP
jgi:hypothetical protein